MDNALYRRRRLVNSFNKTMSFLTVAFGLFWLVWILYTLLWLGLGGLSRWTLFTQSTPPPGSQGGLANAIYGSLLMTLFGTLIGTPVAFWPASTWRNLATVAGWRRPRALSTTSCCRPVHRDWPVHFTKCTWCRWGTSLAGRARWPCRCW